MVELVVNDHPPAHSDYLAAVDFHDESPIPNPVEDDALNIVKALLEPTSATPPRWAVQI